MTNVALSQNRIVKPTWLATSLVGGILGNGAGVMGAQLISFASMAAVARLYSPSDLGYLGLFMSLVAVLTPLGTLSYPNAICYARSHGHAIALAALGATGALALSLLVGILGIAASNFQTDALTQAAFLGSGILASALMAITTQSIFRARLIRVRSTVLILVSAIVALVRIGVGWHSPSSIGLVGSAILGFLLTSVLLLVFGLRVSWPKLARAVTRAPLRRCARLYEEFPRYTMPQALIRYGTVSAPTLALGAIMGPALAGQYTLATAAVSAPLLMVADAVGDAIARPLAQRAEHDRKDALRIALCLSKTLALLVTPVLLLFLLVPHWVMTTAFGPGWDFAGDFARLLVSWTGAMLVTRPLICLVPAFEMQKLLLRNELQFGALRLGVFFAGLLVMNSAVLAVAGFALLGLVLSLVNALRVVRSAEQGDVAQ